MSVRLPTRFLIISNELPAFGDASGAIASRFILTTLTESFLGHEDIGLEDKLIAELPGILNWALGGLERISRQRFTVPKSSAKAVAALQDLVSPMSKFVRECCDQGGPDKTVVIDTCTSAIAIGATAKVRKRCQRRCLDATFGPCSLGWTMKSRTVSDASTSALH